MVEYAMDLDSVFGALSDGTRRDILRRLLNAELSIGEIAKPYDLTFAAISKHLKVLEKAKLIIKRRRGKEQMVQIDPVGLKDASEFFTFYEQLWIDRFDALEEYLKEG
jgi:DNA-binding transcriptional ArsR family regulator